MKPAAVGALVAVSVAELVHLFRSLARLERRGPFRSLADVRRGS